MILHAYICICVCIVVVAIQQEQYWFGLVSLFDGISTFVDEQYWTSPGGNTQQSSSYTPTDHPPRKLSKLDKPDTQDTAGEVGTKS